MKIVVLAGGISTERDVSIVSGTMVCKALRENGEDSEAYQSLSDLRASMDGLSEFYDGLVDYTDGASELADGASKLLDGSSELAGVYAGEEDASSTGMGKLLEGAQELCGGTREIKGGTAEFRDRTSGLDEDVRGEIDDIVARKTGSDVPEESFVDPRNRDVESVQFVITTPSIRAKAPEEESQPTPEKKTFLDRLLDLFR